MNGDGLEDLVEDRWNTELEESELKVRRSSGNGFDSSSTIPTPGNWPGRTIRDIEEDYAGGQLRIADFNNDGRSDILVSRHLSTGLFQWTGSKMARADDFDLQVYDAGQNVQPMDYNGDGLMDIVTTTSGGGDDRDLRIFKRLGDVPDRLIRIGDPNMTPTVDVEYTNLADRDVHIPADDGCAYPIICPVSGGTVVATHSVASRLVAGEITWTTFTTGTAVRVWTCTVGAGSASPGTSSTPMVGSLSPTSTTRLVTWLRRGSSPRRRSIRTPACRRR